MAVYVTGDCHGDWYKLLHWSPAQKGDFVIVCGDFGIWHDYKDKTESKQLNNLAKLNHTILWCDGNHENFDRLYGGEFEEVDFMGGRAHKIRDNVYHLMRGNIFDIEGKKFFVFGGASSHDVEDGIFAEEDYDSEYDFYEAIREAYRKKLRYRVKGISWWERELPTEEEIEFARQNLKEHGNEVDYVISHCLPQQAASVFSNGEYKPDKLTTFLDEVVYDNKFTRWYCGHYHTDTYVMGKFVVLYDEFERVV